MNVDKVKEYGKAIVAFVSTFSVFAAAVIAIPGIGAVLPATWLVWLGIVAASGLIGGVVAGSPANKLPQAKLDQIRGDVQDQVTKAAVGGAAVATTVVTDLVQKYVQEKAVEFAYPGKAQVLDIANKVPAVVNVVKNQILDDVLDKYRSSK